MALGEAFDVGFVNHGLVPRGARLPVVAPGEGGIDDRRERRFRGVVAIVEREVAIGMSHPVAEHLVAPLDDAADGLGVRIEDDLVVVEAVPLVRSVRAKHPVAVELPRADVGEIHVPNEVGVLLEPDAVCLDSRSRVVEETEVHGGGVFGEQGEVRAHPVPGRSERVGLAGQGTNALHGRTVPKRQASANLPVRRRAADAIPRNEKSGLRRFSGLRTRDEPEPAKFLAREANVRSIRAGMHAASRCAA